MLSISDVKQQGRLHTPAPGLSKEACWSSRRLHWPMSDTLTRCWLVTSTLWGFRSRCTMPLSCRASSPCPMSSAACILCHQLVTMNSTGGFIGFHAGPTDLDDYTTCIACLSFVCFYSNCSSQSMHTCCLEGDRQTTAHVDQCPLRLSMTWTDAHSDSA